MTLDTFLEEKSTVAMPCQCSGRLLLREHNKSIINHLLSELEKEVGKEIGVTDRHMTEEQYNDTHLHNSTVRHIISIINKYKQV